MKIIILAILILCLGCSCIEYKSDAGLVSSASANIDVFPVKINSQYCITHNKINGTCAFGIKRNIDTQIKIMPLSYSYEISIDCTDSLGFEIDDNGVKEKEKIFTITSEYYINIGETFYCKGEIYPNGKRPASVSFRFLVSLIDIGYVDLPAPTKHKKEIVLGQHAYKTTCCKGNKCKFYSKKTVIKDKNFDICYVESAAGRGSVYVKTN